MAEGVSDIYVATDDERICDCVRKFGGKAIITGEFKSGSDRIHAASQGMECDVIVNVQGDEPMIDPRDIEMVIEAFSDDTVEMATLSGQMRKEDYSNPDVVKVITDINDNAIYFSRAAIPFFRDDHVDLDYCGRHIGIYGFKKDFLEEYVHLPESRLEKAEKLEQLRAIENGHKIKIIRTNSASIGVDTPGQIGIVEELLKKNWEK